MGAVVIVGFLIATARAAEWPLVLPTNPFGIIPHAQGMDFFLGTWRQGGSRPQGGPMVVTKKMLEFPETSDFGYQYRVIFEAPNYILMVTRVEPPESEHPTKFQIFTLQSFGDTVVRNTELRRHSCDYGTWGTFEAFDWPIEKLLDTFRKSYCFLEIEIDGTISIGWGHHLHIRVGPWD